jgi:1,2-diacylglycerol 3-alpha-glucosyltransferase
VKILVVSSHEQEFGGGEGRLAYEFAIEMSKRHEVLFVYPGKGPKDLPPGARLTVHPIRSLDYVLPALRARELGAVLRHIGAFRPDIIHSHTPWFLGAIVQAWAFIHGVPFFFTAHELPSKMLEWGLVRYLRGILQSPLLHALTRTYLVSFCRHCTGVVALNKAAAEDIRGIGYRGRLSIIPNGRTLAMYNGTGPADIESREKVLAFIGDFGPRKNQKFLVEVMSRLPVEYRLLLIGHDVDHRYRREIDASIRSDLRPRVTFTGRLDHSLIPAQLARTHLWVSASLMEVQSLAVLEALASGTPVLGLSNETIDELIDSQVGMRLDRGSSPEEFARAVRAICETDRESYRELCRNARERVRNYDWAHAVALTERMYERSLARGVPSRRGTLAIPVLLAAAQMLIAMIVFRVLQLTAPVARGAGKRAVRAAAVSVRALKPLPERHDWR